MPLLFAMVPFLRSGRFSLARLRAEQGEAYGLEAAAQEKNAKSFAFFSCAWRQRKSPPFAGGLPYFFGAEAVP
jgi:hypothetical protein